MNLRKLILIFSILALTATSCSSDGTSEGSTYTRAGDETPTTTETPAETAAPAEDESSEEGRDELIALLTIVFDLETEPVNFLKA